ncbi:thrombospondin type 1 domain protein [Onchocerca flexuosa]|uniref:Zinc metalloproteinase n=1 Tax=Onchocerca flexuosa TaxID=387005 RepID=A0A238BQX7_9BILA|nr:thrombospondin type 1 domain protein [Onchocerca flexuosa]
MVVVRIFSKELHFVLQIAAFFITNCNQCRISAKAYDVKQSAVDSKKDVSISTEQPKTVSKLTPYLFEGDIFLSTKQAMTILQSLANKNGTNNKDKRRIAHDAPLYLFNGGQRNKRFSADPEAKWSNFPIKYRFDESLDILQISQILKALETWQNSTCITFENDQEACGDYIEFFEGDGCYSMIGRFGGRQGVSIGKGCERIGTIVHEIGHTLGVWHEQSRPDAEKYITVAKDHIIPSYISEFLQRSENEIVTFDVPYDLGSIMHYGSIAFSVDQKSKTLLTRDPFYQMTIGQRDSLSFYDIKLINEAYCKGYCKEEDECKNGGYLNPSNCKSCFCPSGFGGSKCEMHDTSKSNSKCGGTLRAEVDWQQIESPGYPDGYPTGITCNWLIQTDEEERIEIIFEDDFGIFCSTTCVDYIELKIGDDLANTGYRICCYDKPENSLVSVMYQAVIIFHAAIQEDTGFKLKFRKTTEPAQTTPALLKTTTTVPRTTIDGDNIWSEWGEWSQCSRPCGACGIQSRTRMCKTAQCSGKGQEFSTCNLHACPEDPKCAKVKFKNRLCADGDKCGKPGDILSSCSRPSCCPPFQNVGGICENDQPLLIPFA